MGADEQTWQAIYRNLLQLLQEKNWEVQGVLTDCQLLKDRFFQLHDRWLSDVGRLQDKIAELREANAAAGMDYMLLEAKMDLMVATGRKKTAVYKMKSDSALSDLKDLEVVFRYLISKEADYKFKLEKMTEEMEKAASDQDEKLHRNLQAEIKKLKHLNGKLASEKNSELNSLLQERNFVWNQFKKMESDYSNLMKDKRSELELAAKKISHLQKDADKFSLLIKEKDIVIGSLQEEIKDKENKLVDYSKEISKLSEDLELLKKSSNPSSMQLRPCSLKQPTSDDRDKVDAGAHLRNCTRNLLSTPNEKKILSALSSTESRRTSSRLKDKGSLQASAGTKTSEQGSRKRRRHETPFKNNELLGLFSSNFKVPKLKNTPTSG